MIAIPRGADVTGTVVDARGPGKLKGKPHLALQLTGVNFSSTTYPLVSQVWARGGPGKGGQSAANIGGSAAAGAIIGGAVGGGPTALLGGLLGGLGGAGLSSLSSGPQLYIPPESVLTFYLSAPVTVHVPTYRRDSTTCVACSSVRLRSPRIWERLSAAAGVLSASSTGVLSSARRASGRVPVLSQFRVVQFPRRFLQGKRPCIYTESNHVPREIQGPESIPSGAMLRV